MSSARSKPRRADTALTPAAERVREADRRFFERRPDRNHLVRYAALAELADLDEAAGRLIGERLPIAAPGRRWFAIVKQVRPGARMRLYRQNGVDTPIDLTEEQARQVYERVASPGDRETEAKIAAAFDRRGGGR